MNVNGIELAGVIGVVDLEFSDENRTVARGGAFEKGQSGEANNSKKRLNPINSH